MIATQDQKKQAKNHQGIGKIVDGAVLVAQDVFLPVVLDVGVHVFLGVDVDFRLTLLGLDADH